MKNVSIKSVYSFIYNTFELQIDWLIYTLLKFKFILLFIVYNNQSIWIIITDRWIQIIKLIFNLNSSKKNNSTEKFNHLIPNDNLRKNL